LKVFFFQQRVHVLKTGKRQYTRVKKHAVVRQQT